MPDIWNSGSFQPTTIFSAKRPRPTWSAVIICFAATIGLNRGAWTVPNTVMRLVLARRPVAQVTVSKVEPWKLVGPP